jgi:hypothetical protein
MAQAQPLGSGRDAQKPKRKTAITVLRTAGHMTAINSIPDARAHAAKAVAVIDKGIASGATKASGFFAKLGWKKLAASCLKIAAASPLAAKIVVTAAIVAVAICIFRVVQSA